jgi:hypothetical protein
MVKYTQLPKASRGYTWTEDEKYNCKDKSNAEEKPSRKFINKV